MDCDGERHLCEDLVGATVIEHRLADHTLDSICYRIVKTTNVHACMELNLNTRVCNIYYRKTGASYTTRSTSVTIAGDGPTPTSWVSGGRSGTTGRRWSSWSYSLTQNQMARRPDLEYINARRLRTVTRKRQALPNSSRRRGAANR